MKRKIRWLLAALVIANLIICPGLVIEGVTTNDGRPCFSSVCDPVPTPYPTNHPWEGE